MKKERARSTSRGLENSKCYFSYLSTDPEERRWIEHVLRMECEFLNTGAVEDGTLIFVKDWDGNYLMVNEEMAKLYATGAERMTDRSESDLGLMPPEKAEYLLREDRELMHKKQRQYVRGAVFQNAGGKTHEFDVVKMPIINGDGACRMLLFVARPAEEYTANGGTVEAERPDGQVRDPEAARISGPARPRILILNDEYLNAILIKKILNMKDFDVDSAESVNAAIDMAGLKKYDLILTNEQMLLNNGSDAAFRLLGSGIKTPIVAMIKKRSDENIRKCVKAGMCNYIEKPFTLEKIIEMIERYAPASGAKRAGRQIRISKPAARKTMGRTI